jgi:hypothetical protein
VELVALRDHRQRQLSLDQREIHSRHLRCPAPNGK